MQLKSMTMGACLSALALATLMMSVTAAAAGDPNGGVNTTGATPSCEAQAAEQKLSGSDKDSFIAKCQADAKAAPPATGTFGGKRTLPPTAN